MCRFSLPAAPAGLRPISRPGLFSRDHSSVWPTRMSSSPRTEREREAGEPLPVMNVCPRLESSGERGRSPTQTRLCRAWTRWTAERPIGRMTKSTRKAENSQFGAVQTVGSDLQKIESRKALTASLDSSDAIDTRGRRDLSTRKTSGSDLEADRSRERVRTRERALLAPHALSCSPAGALRDVEALLMHD